MGIRHRGMRGAAAERTGVCVERTVRPDRGGVSAVERGAAVADVHDCDELFLHRGACGRLPRGKSEPEGVSVGVRGAVFGGLSALGEHPLARDALHRLRRDLRLCLGLFVQRRARHGRQVVSRQAGTDLRHPADGLRHQQLPDR